MITYIIGGLKAKDRKATQKTVATIIKGYKIKEQFLNRTPALKKLKEGCGRKVTQEFSLLQPETCDI